MYIFKNAWISIWRNKGRNILICIIIIAIAASCTISLAINNSATKLIKSYQDSYEITASLTVNRGAFMENLKNQESDMDSIRKNFNNIESLTLEEIKNYGDSDYVSRYTYTESIDVNAKKLEKATNDMPNNRGNKGNKLDGTEPPDFTLLGYNCKEAMQNFINNTYEMADGIIDENFENPSCIINKELAEINDIEVQDEITIVNPNDTSKKYVLTVTGIFEDKESSEGMNLFSNSANTIITNTSVVENIYKDDEELKLQVTPTYYLTSNLVVDNFASELEEKGLNKYYTVATNEEEAIEALSSISNLKSFSITFLIITLLIGGIVLFVINMINVRERKYEIGVLRTIGMKKMTVSLQFMLELSIVSLIALSLGLGIASLASVPTANNLLKNEIENSTEKQENIRGNFGDPQDRGERPNKPLNNFRVRGVANIERIDKINAVVDLKVIMELFGVSILLTVISSLASLGAITHFKPLTILKERS